MCANGERFWVCVNAAGSDGHISGWVDNELIQPLNRARWRRGDAIELHQRHVLDVKGGEDRYAFVQALIATRAWDADGDFIVSVDSEKNAAMSVDNMFQEYMACYKHRCSR